MGKVKKPKEKERGTIKTHNPKGDVVSGLVTEDLESNEIG